MLKVLAIRNAKRQSGNYLIYFLTLIFSVVLLYGFNALTFSKELQAISAAQIKGMIQAVVLASVLIVLILGWLVNYMMNFMLNKRSRELGTYMMLGVENTTITKMFFQENLIFGCFALMIGFPLGIIFSELLKSIVFTMFSQVYLFKLAISLPAICLTGFYMVLIFCVSFYFNHKKIQEMSLKDLLYLENLNEQDTRSKPLKRLLIFGISCVCGITGLFFLVAQPLGKLYDLSVGVVLLILFIFGFYLNLSAVILHFIETNHNWKYKKMHLVLYRSYASKISSMRMTIILLAVIFMLSLAAIGSALGFKKIVDRQSELSSFDITVLHQGHKEAMPDYSNELKKYVTLKNSHEYNLYTTGDQTFSGIRNKVNESYSEWEGEPYKEFRQDVYMKLSDYQKLRAMLGLEPVALKEKRYLIHCCQYLKSALLKAATSYQLTDANLAFSGIQTEDFNQYSPYGNGYGFVIVVPDEVLDSSPVLYSLYAAKTGEMKANKKMEDFIASKKNRSTLIKEETMIGLDHTLLINQDDYVSGQLIEQEVFSGGITLLLPLSLLGFILCITGITLLATQILSDGKKMKKQFVLLDYLGVTETNRQKLLIKQLLLYFVTPLITVFVMSGVLTFIFSRLLANAYFSFPVFFSNVWIWKLILFSDAAFLCLYGIYFMLVYRLALKQIKN